MSVPEAALHDFVDRNAEIFRGRNIFREFWQQIQILMIVPLQDSPAREAVQVRQVADHPRLLIYWPADRDFDNVVVAMPVWVIALAVDLAVPLSGELLAVQAMRSGKHVAPGQVGLHASP